MIIKRTTNKTSTLLFAHIKHQIVWLWDKVEIFPHKDFQKLYVIFMMLNIDSKKISIQ